MRIEDLATGQRACLVNAEQKLVDAGVLVEVESRTRTRLFLAAQILRTINGELQ